MKPPKQQNQQKTTEKHARCINLQSRLYTSQTAQTQTHTHFTGNLLGLGTFLICPTKDL